MIKRAAIFILVLLAVCLPLILPAPALAQSGPNILHTAAAVNFPTGITFSLAAESAVDIVDIRLHYTIDRTDFADITSEIYIEFPPATTVDVDWTLEMLIIGGLPTGAGLEYWWTVRDARGGETKTPPATVAFADRRYDWRSIAEGEVAVYWYQGDESFAREILLSARQAMELLAADTGARLESPVALYIYGSSEDLMGAMIHPREWTGGVAFTRFGIISLGIAPSNLAWGKRAVTHEMAHLVVHQMTLNPYGNLPVWLDEGLAMYAEGVLEPQFASLLHRAVREDALISVRSLSSPFSAFGDIASLSYAESYSLVAYLVSEYGQDKMLELLNTFSRGSSYDEALEAVYGFDTEGLDAEWRVHITRLYGASAGASRGLPVPAVALAVPVTGLLLGSGLLYRKRSRGR